MCDEREKDEEECSTVEHRVSSDDENPYSGWISLDKDIIDKLDNEATAHDMKRSEVARLCIARYFDGSRDAQEIEDLQKQLHYKDEKIRHLEANLAWFRSQFDALINVEPGRVPPLNPLNHLYVRSLIAAYLKEAKEAEGISQPKRKWWQFRLFRKPNPID